MRSGTVLTHTSAQRKSGKGKHPHMHSHVHRDSPSLSSALCLWFVYVAYFSAYESVGKCAYFVYGLLWFALRAHFYEWTLRPLELPAPHPVFTHTKQQQI